VKKAPKKAPAPSPAPAPAPAPETVSTPPSLFGDSGQENSGSGM
jgi:hypothetical protein